MNTSRIRRLSAAGGIVVAGLAGAALPSAQATPDSAPQAVAPAKNSQASGKHFFETDKQKKQRLTRQDAVTKLLNGRATLERAADGRQVIRVGSDTFVEYDVNRKAKLFMLLTEFGDQKQDGYGEAGPLHNNIEKPHESDNFTIWKDDFNVDYYKSLMFGEGETFQDFYKKQSIGRFDVSGDVQDWVKLPFNEARYGKNDNQQERYHAYVRDSVTAWYEAQVAAGKTPEQIREAVKEYDVWDRYDYDGDGVFNEPDGYLDHLQLVHAGVDESAGGGAQGDDAIWAHRWYANPSAEEGPDGNRQGGWQIGDTGIWVGDYQVMPENGGLGVFTHEFGHDLGLPDLYDTAGGKNGVTYWSLMSSGSWLGPGGRDAGSKANYMGPWEKLQLGWLDYTEVVPDGRKHDVKLGPADMDGTNTPQAILVNLGEKDKVVELVAPHSGEKQWWTGSDDNLNNTLTREIDLSAASEASVSAFVASDIEADYDFLEALVSTDGEKFERVGDIIDGKRDYSQVTWDLSKYAGQKVWFQFHYYSDGGVAPIGGFIDDIAITVDGNVVFEDDAEGEAEGWTADGFSRVGASVTERVPHYYLIENRRYAGYDKYLKTGPYQFLSDEDDEVTRVRYFSYLDGMLVWYSDGAVKDNNTSQHPGSGNALIVDANPEPIKYADGMVARNRYQTYDSAFSTFDRLGWQKFTEKGKTVTVDRPKANPTFHDASKTAYWNAENPQGSTMTAGSGMKASIKFPLAYRAYSVVELDFTDTK